MHVQSARPAAIFAVVALLALSVLQPITRQTAFARTTAAPALRALSHGAPYTIALANSFIGNTWRVEMEDEFRGACQMPPLKTMVKCTAYNSGNDVSKQTQQIDNLISSKVDAIVIDAASPTGLNGAIAQACSAGILVVSYDNQVTAPCALQINTDEVAFGKQMATYLVAAMHNKGNVVMVTGVAGTSADRDRNTGAMAVFNKYPGIKVLSKYTGMWASDVAQRNTASALPSLGKIDGFWVQGGTDGVIRSLLAAHRPLVPFAGEAENGFREYMLQYKSKGWKAISVGQPPFLSLMALQLALEVLEGKRPKGNVSMVNFPFVTTDTVKEGATAFKNLPSAFFDDFTDSGPNAVVVICVGAATKGTACPGTISIRLPKS